MYFNMILKKSYPSFIVIGKRKEVRKYLERQLIISKLAESIKVIGSIKGESFAFEGQDIAILATTIAGTNFMKPMHHLRSPAATG